MDQAIKVGSTIPDFQINDTDGNEIKKEDLLGSPFVIYFYPKDDTPGCTIQACEFRDIIDEFNDVDVSVVGVSPDNKESHQKFIDKFELNFPLLCDEKMEMAKKFGITQPKAEGGCSLIRSTFLCNEDGEVLWLESPVKVEGHVGRVLEAVKNLSNE